MITVTLHWLAWAGVVMLILLVVIEFVQRLVRKRTQAEEMILHLLAQHPPLFGLELVDLSGGVLKRGTVYVLLGRLQDLGLVVALEPDIYGRRPYTLRSKL